MNQPQNPWAPTDAPPPPKSSTALNIVLALGLGALLLVAAGAFGFSYLMRQSHSPPPQPVDHGALRQVPGDGDPRRFGGTAVFDACSVITIAQLTDLGVPLAQDSITHEHLDGDVPAGDAVPQIDTDSVSYCSYPLTITNSLTVSVHQTPFNTTADLTSRQEAATRLGSTPRTEDGLSLAQWHDKTFELHHIDVWRHDLRIEVGIDTHESAHFGTMDVQTFAAKLEPLVKAAIAKGPTAPMRHVYTGPLSEVRNPCEVADRTAFRRAFPSQTGPASMVEGNFYPTSSSPDGQSDMSCSRHNLVPNGELNQTEYRELHVTMSVSDTSQAASTHNTALCTESTSSNVIVTPAVGTGRTCLMGIGSDWELKFQLDRVNISMRGPLTENPTVDERRSQLLPAAQAIASAGVIR